TIRDISGFEFLFEEADVDTKTTGFYNNPVSFNTTYHLSQIKDKANIELAIYTYNGPTYNRKLEKINLPSQGEILFSYIYTPSNRTDIEIKNNHGETIRKLELRFTVAALGKELLSSVRFFDKASDEHEEYKLPYKYHSISPS